MKGQIFAISVIILGLYILISALTGRGATEDRASSAQLYHIGCYDMNHSLSHSKNIAQHLQQLSHQFEQTSVSKIAAINKKLLNSVYRQTGGNELAQAFEKYIATYQNIKSRNQYQQSFFNTLKQTKDQFLLCREKFNQKPWNCRNVSQEYNQTDERFRQLKIKMETLMTERALHLNKTEELLKDEDVSKDAEYTEKYTKEIDILNQMIAKKHQKIKQNNETLMNLVNDIFKVENQLNSTKKLLQECSKNKAEIDFCKNISDYVKSLYDEVNLQEIVKSMKQKRMIIDLLKSHLIQSKKLGEDTQAIEEELQTAKQQLEQEETLYHETNNTGKCGLELQFKCSHDNIKQLQANLTTLNAELIRLLQEKQSIDTKLNKDIYEKNQFQSRIDLLTEELKNSAIDIEHLKLKEERKKRQLQQYRTQLNQIIINIGNVSLEIAQAKVKRTEQSKKIDEIMERGEDLIECLSKKELFLKLDTKKPKNTEEDQILKQEASQSLTAVIQKLLKQ